MDIDNLFSRLAIALGIGLLIGLERGWKTRDAAPGTRAAGIRTFALCGLMGGLAAALAQATGTAVATGLVLGLSFAVYAAVFAMFERDAARAAGSYSATTVVAALLTFILGAYAAIGDARAAAAAAIVATGILASRNEIHRWVARTTWPELRSALVLLAMSFIVLPILPESNVLPGGVLNLREVWVIAIVLAAVSFLGYGAVKYFGARRGVLLSALAGGLVSSTAVTMTSASRAARQEGAPSLLAAGVAIASAVSFLRVIAIIAAMQPVLLGAVAPALIASILVAVFYAVHVVYGRRDGGAGGTPKPAPVVNPFSFWPVVGFAVFLGAVIVLGRAIADAFGAQGALLGAVGLGLADVDAVTISLARLVPEPLGAFAASLAILAAVASNMVSKLAIAVFIGRGRFAVEVAAVTVACWAAGAAAFWGIVVFAPGLISH
ncbi:MAG: MgtC/SapB family protein [Pseudolabrys sp.]|nr:MgtC/SapB family protein [Pseudolabrys sp.]